MCGISGIISNKPDSAHLVEAMNNRIAHRGPDDSGIWQGEGVVLGHRRLSILDLSQAGKQPMGYCEGRYWIVYNGEVYNFVEIRDDLRKKGFTFKSESDTEVILAAFIEWGAGCLNKFNGMWSLSIWDCKERTLFLSRDRFGIKPLFYCQNNDLFAFSSEMKGLFPVLKEIKPNLPVIEKAKASVFSYEITEDCLIEGIKRLPPGSYGIFRNNRLDIRKWWHTLDHLPEIPGSYQEQVEQFRELFLDACRIRMRSDVSIGTCLSGGLDSSAIACAMKHIGKHSPGYRQTEDWQHAFVATFPGSPIDELKYARKVVEHTGIAVDYIEINPLDVISDIDKMLYSFEEIYLTSPIPFMQTYKRVREGGVVVTLDGHGSDELFGGYPWDVLSLLSSAGLNLKKALYLFDIYKEMYEDNAKQTGGSLGIIRSVFSTWIKHNIKSIIGKHGRQTGLPVPHPKYSELDKLAKTLYTETHDTVLPTLLRNYDRYSMANGVEIRMPFMDWRIVTFAFALPWQAKIGGGFTKRLVRDAMAPYMPYDIAYRKTKIGFNTPVVEWFQGPLKPWLLDILHSRDLKESSLVDGKKVAALGLAALNSPNMQWGDGEHLWHQLTPYLWERAVIGGVEN